MMNIRDIELAKEEAQNGEGTEDDEEDVGEKREKGGVTEGTVVVNKTPTYQYHHGSSPLPLPLSLPLHPMLPIFFHAFFSLLSLSLSRVFSFAIPFSLPPSLCRSFPI